MDWIVEALHQSHADEKRFREDAITRLQEEQSKIQNRLDRLYDDRLDGFIEPDFFERKSREWRQTQKRLADQITEYQEAAHDYVQDGIRLLELSKKPIFCINSKIQAKSESCSISCVRTQHGRITLSLRRLANRLIYLQLRIRLGKEKRPPEPIQRPSSYLAPQVGLEPTTLWFTVEGRIAVCIRWHLGSVEQRRTISYLVCDHHDRSERTRRNTSRSYMH
jgi:hypothetical protein